MFDLTNVCSELHASRLSGLSRTTIRRYQKLGMLNSQRVSNRLTFYRISDIENLRQLISDRRRAKN